MDNLILIGTPARRQIFRTRLPDLLPLAAGTSPDDLPTLPPGMVIVDLNLDETPARLGAWRELAPACLLGAAVLYPMGAMLAASGGPAAFPCFGLNALPGMLERPVWEVSSPDPAQAATLTSLLARMGVTGEQVADRTGMVTPRILCLILNEAFLMAQEGSARPEDIDIAMQLGVNYPAGPFAWADKLGLPLLLTLLERLWADTGETRFRPAHLLRTRAMPG
ncbi:MAG: 3-hydroxyacyl-CoA dehydrogenase family protein [Bacteroidia bacterium]|nr:3-hydroxyacyl-CoA dehydrogenase family protein [Bacteroidia bacterium]